MSWSPDAAELSNIFSLLQALRDPSRHDHSQAVQVLPSCISVSGPDGSISSLNSSFILHLLFLFVYGSLYENSGITSDVRQLSGLVIKNYIFPLVGHFDVDLHIKLKEGMVTALSDALINIRSTASILLGRYSEAFPIDLWGDDVLPSLISMLNVEHLSVSPSNSSLAFGLEGALHAVMLICEDSSEKLSMDLNRRPLDTLVPRLISLCNNLNSKVRQQSIETLNSLVFLIPASGGQSGGYVHALIIHMNSFIQVISSLSSDPEPLVRKAICQSIVLLASHQLALLEPWFDSICEFMLNSLLDNEESVAKESCEFWKSMLENIDAGIAPPTSVSKHFNVLIPNILSRMKLTEDQIIQDRADADAEASGEKKILNVSPVYTQHGLSREDQQALVAEEEELSSEYTIRKTCANILDAIGCLFDSKEVLDVALPLISTLFQSPDAWVRESGLLAFGALSNGCMKLMGPFMPGILPFFVKSLGEEILELRAIACWTISRYSAWFFEFDNGESENSDEMNKIKQGWYMQILPILLNTMLDNKPKVQTAVSSALCILFSQTTPELLLPYVEDILKFLQQVFPTYGIKSKVLILDMIGTIADIVGSDGMSDPNLTPYFLPFIYAFLDSLDDTNTLLIPVLECLTYIMSPMKFASQAYALAIFRRCLRILENTMASNAKVAKLSDLKTNGGEAVLSKDFAICAMDVITSTLEGYQTSSVSLISESKNELLTVLFSCIHDSFPEMRQSAFALSGELLKSCSSILLEEPAIVQIFLQSILENLSLDFPMVFNNAIWTLGILIKCLGQQHADIVVRPFFGRIITSLSQSFHDDQGEVPDTLLQNIAITLGSIALYMTAALSEVVDEFFADWCRSLARLPVSADDAEDTFLGLLAVIHAKPSLLEDPHTQESFVLACTAWSDPPESETVQAGLSQILQVIRQSYPKHWTKFLSRLDPEEKHRLRDNFKIN